MKSHIGRYSVGDHALYTSLTKGTSRAEFLVRFGKNDLPGNKTFYKLIDPAETGKVLDLTNPKILKQLDVNKDDIAKLIVDDTNAYDITQVIGHIAKKKGFKGIIVLSAPDRANKGINFISFKEFP